MQAESLAAAGVDWHPRRDAEHRAGDGRGGALGQSDGPSRHRFDGHRWQGHLLSGESIEEAVRSLASLELEALSINCVPARRLGADLARLAAAAPGVPLVAYGNLGPPTGEDRTVFTEELSPGEYAVLAREWLAIGARIVGGCCGTTTAHTALRRMLDESHS